MSLFFANGIKAKITMRPTLTDCRLIFNKTVQARAKAPAFGRTLIGIVVVHSPAIAWNLVVIVITRHWVITVVVIIGRIGVVIVTAKTKA